MNITYEVEADGAVEHIEQPFVIGVLADLCGHPAEPLPPLADRKFVRVERTALDAVLAAYAPRLLLEIPNRLERGAPRKIELRFQSLADFEPEGVVGQVPALMEAARYPLLEARVEVADAAVAYLRPHFQLADPGQALRVVMSLPAPAG